MKRKLIFAGNHQQSRDYTRDHQLSPSQYAIVSSKERVMGLSPDEWEIVTVGNWWTNNEVAEAYDYLRMHPRWVTK